MKVFNSKKATLTVLGLPIIPTIVGIVVLILNNLGVDPDLVESVAEVLTWVLGLILASYNVGQGIADTNNNKVNQSSQ